MKKIIQITVNIILAAGFIISLILMLMPFRAEALFNTAQGLSAAGQFDAATERFEKSIKTDLRGCRFKTS